MVEHSPKILASEEKAPSYSFKESTNQRELIPFDRRHMYDKGHNERK